MKLSQTLTEAGIDPELSLWVLEKVRKMDAKETKLGSFSFPSIDPSSDLPPFSDLAAKQAPKQAAKQDDTAPTSELGGRAGGSGREDRIIDIRRLGSGTISRAHLNRILESSSFPTPIITALYSHLAAHHRSDRSQTGGSDDDIVLDRRGLELIGLAALPLVSYGVLNGGSASSYIDEKKNRQFNPQLFDLYEEQFAMQATLCRDRAKGLTPGYLNLDKSSGYSFMELKIRAALLLAEKHYRLFPPSAELAKQFPRWGQPLFPLFQMTSKGNHAEILRAYEAYAQSPALSPFFEDGAILTHTAGFSKKACLSFKGGSQPLIAALTHSSIPERNIFLAAGGRKNCPLPLPGGHGQVFFALEDCYRSLEDVGKSYACLGNVDNLAYLPDPVEIALMILYRAPAGFDFSFKTPTDIKGGALIRQVNGKLSCGDIGPAISQADMDEAVKQKIPILFNCAAGIFDLPFLNRNIGRIQQSLPLRVSDQDKDVGRYSQAEQISWEVMGLIEGLIAFGVDKPRRFLAGKVLVENLMTCGIALKHKDFPADLRENAERLYCGFKAIMQHQYGMKLVNHRWEVAARP